MASRLAARPHAPAAALIALALASCGGGSGSMNPPPGTYLLGGNVGGLVTGQSVTLANNGGDLLTVTADGSFTFKTPLASGTTYAITVSTQPGGQNCTVANNTGTVTATVTNIAVTCANVNEYAYVVNNGGNTISQYSVAANGALTPLAPATIATGSSPQSVTVDPTRKFVYVTNLLDNTVSQYVVQGNGTLVPNNPATVATGTRPDGLAFEPNGAFAYVINSGDSNLTQYGVDVQGRLTRTARTATVTGSNPWNLVFTPDGKFAYTSNFGTNILAGSTVQQYSVGASGAGLTALNPPSVITNVRPAGIAVDSTGANLYLAGLGTDELDHFMITSGGQLSLIAPYGLATASAPVYVALNQSGQNLYVVNFSSVGGLAAGTIAQFSVDSSGALSALATPTVATGRAPVWFAFEPRGQYAYVANSGDNNLSAYAVAANGSLTLLGTIVTGVGPFAVAMAY
jgi:6-phosphogluconolactonase